MFRKNKGETSEDTGIFQKSGPTRSAGARIVVIGLIVLFFEIFLLILAINSETVYIDDVTYLRIDWDLVLGLFLLILISVPIIFLVGASNMHYGKKSKNTDYSAGDEYSVKIIRCGKPGAYVYMVKGISGNATCPNCNADLGAQKPKYCPKCGHSLGAESEQNNS